VAGAVEEAVVEEAAGSARPRTAIGRTCWVEADTLEVVGRMGSMEEEEEEAASGGVEEEAAGGPGGEEEVATVGGSTLG
jgi:hypothetical protein